MRRYNHETDRHLIAEAAEKYGKNLTGIKTHFNENGIAWPPRFNDDRSEPVSRLDADICEVWESMPESLWVVDTEPGEAQEPMTKSEAYKSGRWQCPPPPVCSAQWDDSAWIRYIDRDGRWTVAIED